MSGFITKTGVTLSTITYDINLQKSPSIPYPMATVSKESNSKKLLQLYNNLKINTGNSVALNLGIHSLFFDLTKQYVLEPRLGIQYKVNPEITFSFGYGKHSKMEMLHTYFVRDAVTSELINDKLHFARAEHYIAGYEHQIGKDMLMRLELYLQSLWDIPSASGSSLSVINSESNWFTNEKLVNTGTGKNKGVEFTFERLLSEGFYFLTTASVYKSIYSGGDGVIRSTRYDRGIAINAAGGKEWIFGENGRHMFGVNLRINYMGGDKYTPLDVVQSSMRKESVEDLSRAYSQTKPAGTYFDVTLNYRYNAVSSAYILTLQMINVLQVKEFYGYKYNLRTGLFEEDKETMFVPNLTFKVEF